MLLDTHVHLDAAEFDADRDAVIARAVAAGVGGMLLPGVERANFATVRDLARRVPGGAYCLGIHPLFVERSRDDDLDALRSAVADALDDPAFVGVGEIGLDHFVPGLDRERQHRFLHAQLRIARDFDLPVVLHVRRAVDPIAALLRRTGVRAGIAHAFNGSAQQAGAIVDLGFALGFGGECAHPRARRIRALAAGMPAEAVVLETDAPDIPPPWLAHEDAAGTWRRGRNEPAELAGIAREVGALRGLDVAGVAALARDNALRVLPRWRVRLDAPVALPA